MKRKIAVIGARGFVGSAVSAEIQQREGLELIPVVRGDDVEASVSEADIIIHSANSARRFFAQKNPERDFHDTVEKMHDVKACVQGKKMVLVSTISARIQLDTVYGRNRRACELMVMDKPGNLIVRLGPMYGERKAAGALHDILNNRQCFVSGSTRYAYVDVAYNARKIIDLIDYTGVLELGAKDTISLNELKAAIGSTTEFEGPDDTQILNTTQDDAPDAREVVDFAMKFKKEAVR